MGGGGSRDGCNEWAAQGEWGHADWGVMHAGMGTACFKATAMAGLGNEVGGSPSPLSAVALPPPQLSSLSPMPVHYAYHTEWLPHPTRQAPYRAALCAAPVPRAHQSFKPSG
ncbi:hypothetical protein WOLCODRAFT_153346 [Wolfiporia cocos MD-104 SS10]|uniref:Uncharacterized protein n=1 Tax=Wolfiporia cocos (strain MD-104) TaxID=742152 RepID=A0A2H3K2L4_WOLCO|nr:hypothetical protein WOLCODRAFT_153346 [Wolfiporia cocos MD-104 SS10]